MSAAARRHRVRHVGFEARREGKRAERQRRIRQQQEGMMRICLLVCLVFFSLQNHLPFNNSTQNSQGMISCHANRTRCKARGNHSSLSSAPHRFLSLPSLTSFLSLSLSQLMPINGGHTRSQEKALKR